MSALDSAETLPTFSVAGKGDALRWNNRNIVETDAGPNPDRPEGYLNFASSIGRQ